MVRRGEAVKAPSTDGGLMWAEKKQINGGTCDVEREGNKGVDRDGAGMQTGW